MTRLLALLILLLIAAHLYQRARLAIARARDEVARRSNPVGTPTMPLVACAACGVRLPATSAIAGHPGSERRYCSVVCRDRGQDT